MIVNFGAKIIPPIPTGVPVAGQTRTLRLPPIQQLIQSGLVVPTSSAVQAPGGTAIVNVDEGVALPAMPKPSELPPPKESFMTKYGVIIGLGGAAAVLGGALYFRKRRK